MGLFIHLALFGTYYLGWWLLAALAIPWQQYAGLCVVLTSVVSFLTIAMVIAERKNGSTHHSLRGAVAIGFWVLVAIPPVLAYTKFPGW